MFAHKNFCAKFPQKMDLRIVCESYFKMEFYNFLFAESVANFCRKKIQNFAFPKIIFLHVKLENKTENYMRIRKYFANVKL